MADSEVLDPIPIDSFGARLALIRQYRGGLNVARAASMCGLDDQSWRNWEAGRSLPQDYPGVCLLISERLGIDYTWLMVGGPIRTQGTSEETRKSRPARSRNHSYPEELCVA